MARGGDDAGVGDGLELSLRLGTPTSPPAPRNNNLTIVYDQRVLCLCSVDVVEMQAMAIISMASRETTTMGKSATDNCSITQLNRRCSKVTPTWRALRAPSPASPEHGGIVAPIPPALIGEQAGGLSMKRSLQRFLEKRKGRAAAASPYGVHRQAQPPRS